MSKEALRTLCEVRLAAERQAEQEFVRATALLGREREREAGLAAELDAARAGRDRARGDFSLAPGNAAALQLARRYADRLESELRAAAAALEAHVRGPLAAGLAAVDRARADHLRASQRREAVERAIARREAARRRDQERRAEAAEDDLAQRRR